jgi:hypothetical protein
MTTELPLAIAQPTNLGLVKESVKQKVVIDSAVAKATIAKLLAKAGKTPQQSKAIMRSLPGSGVKQEDNPFSPKSKAAGRY